VPYCGHCQGSVTGARWDDIETARNTRQFRHQRDSNRAIGGTGLIGSKTVAILRQNGHEVVAASPKSSVNSITGEGLKLVMAGAQVDRPHQLALI
jgi:glutamate dehydrogenase/leucine dehydrogenase